VTTLKADHPALKGRTVFMKSVKDPAKVGRMLQPAVTNTKMGKGKTYITRGRWRGMPLYLLSLEERKTCPKTCQQWSNCYGNNMPFANRLDHTATSFYATLTNELGTLSRKHPSGFAVRLHVLGDFFSMKYVRYWQRMQKNIPQLMIYGYTHRYPGTPIGDAIAAWNDGDRTWIRFSDRGGAMSANVGAAVVGDEIQCPEEVGKTESCLTCGLCWQTTKPIKFLEH
jgi:hypothetical protein